MASTDQYTSLVTSEHQKSVNFLAMISAVTQAFVDNQNLLAQLPTDFDLDIAIGDQLDKVGQRVGRSRYLTVPLPNVYFSLDTDGLGLDQGVWYESFNPINELVRLPDDEYRILLYAVIAANHWDGTIPGAYAAYEILFEPLGYRILIQDYDDMTMALALLGDGIIPAVTLALFTTGELDLRPDGVMINAHMTQSVAGAPLFALDVSAGPNLAGLDTGCWAILSFPE